MKSGMSAVLFLPTYEAQLVSRFILNTEHTEPVTTTKQSDFTPERSTTFTSINNSKRYKEQ